MNIREGVKRTAVVGALVGGLAGATLSVDAYKQLREQERGYERFHAALANAEKYRGKERPEGAPPFSSMVVVLDKDHRPLVVGDEYGNPVDRVEKPLLSHYFWRVGLPPIAGAVAGSVPLLLLGWIIAGFRQRPT
jgi:hypothetical protein